VRSVRDKSPSCVSDEGSERADDGDLLVAYTSIMGMGSFPGSQLRTKGAFAAAQAVLPVYRGASRSPKAAENRTTTSRGRWLSTTRLIRPSAPRLIAVTPQTGKPIAAPSHSKYVRSVDWVSCINSSRS